MKINNMYKILKNIPGDFPIIERPYDEMANNAGMSEVEFLSALNKLKKEGIIRRIAAVLFHRRASYTHNAMVVWKVKDDDVDRAGGIMASFPEVSHCYEREKGDYWDYNLYTMIHGKSLEDCKEIAGRISEHTGIKNFQMFFSKREFKKIPLRVIYE
ncbi:MAG: Lrp/AsnC family transcriptional regulator [Proteobacteria bacterium]|nr:Lrp/AsnC family transcriptional regulator [Pseudomonadota bacterium]